MNILFSDNDLFFICFLVFTFLYIITMSFVSNKNSIFTVYFTDKNKKADEEVKNFYLFFFYIAVFFFAFSFIAELRYKNLFFLSLFIFFYFIIYIIKFMISKKKIFELKLSNEHSNIKEKSPFFLGISSFIIHLVFIFYTIFTINNFAKQEFKIYKNLLLTIPLSLIFILITSLIIYILVIKAPPFATKKVKKHILNIISLISFLFILVITFLLTVITSLNDIILLLCELSFIICLFILILKYKKYIRLINFPFNFKVQNINITGGNPIEISPDGTKLFINFKNKKSYFLAAGFIILIIIYFVLLFLLII